MCDSVSGLTSLLIRVALRTGASSIHRRIVQSSGFHNGYQLHLEVPLDEEEGDRLLASFLVNRAESPLSSREGDWSEGSMDRAVEGEVVVEGRGTSSSM